MLSHGWVKLSDQRAFCVSWVRSLVGIGRFCHLVVAVSRILSWIFLLVFNSIFVCLVLLRFTLVLNRLTSQSLIVQVLFRVRPSHFQSNNSSVSLSSLSVSQLPSFPQTASGFDIRTSEQRAPLPHMLRQQHRKTASLWRSNSADCNILSSLSHRHQFQRRLLEYFDLLIRVLLMLRNYHRGKCVYLLI